MNTLSYNLKKYREIKNLTQKSMADLLEVTTRSYQRYEAGEREPDVDSLIKIADTFEISLDELVGRIFP